MKRIYNIITSLMLLAILGVLGTSNTYAAAPTVSARNLSFSNIQSTTATIGWINGNGTGRLVVVFPNSTDVATIDAAVTDGTIYTGNTAYGSGASISTGYAVYRGTGSTRTVNVTGLSAGTEYNVKVYEYKNDGGTDPEYRLNAGTNNPRSFTTVFTPPTNLATTSITAQGWTAGWTDILVDGYEIRITDNSDVVISGWDNIDIGDIVTYDVTNLMNGTNYKWSVRAYNGNSYSAYATYLTVTTLTDNTPPTITSVGVSDAVISEADAAATFTITLTFNEDMDNGIDPVITFDANVITTLTNGSGYWQDQRIYTRNYTIADVNEYANGVDVIVNSAKDVAGNTMAEHNETNEFSVDMLAPTAFTVGSVLTSDGTVVAGYYNASNDGLDVTVPIASDNSLTGGTIQIQAKIGANNFENIGVSNTIFVENLNATQSVSLTDANIMGITDFAENAVISFRAIITDNVGNSTTGAASNTTITNDQVAPSAPTPTFTSNGTGSFTGFYNANATGINISYTVPNEVGGGYTVRVIQSNPALSVGFPLLAAGGTIVAPVVEMPTNTNTNFNQATEVASIDISDGDLTTAGFVNNNGSQDPYSMYSYVVITDAAGNSTTGANSTLIAIEETRPTVTITRNAITNGSNFRTNDATVSFDIDFTKQVSNFGIADISVNDPGDATFDLVEAGDLVVDGAPSNGDYTFTLTNVDGDGTLGITLVKTDFTDLAGNELAENAVSELFTIDNTLPTVVSINRKTPLGQNTNADEVVYEVTFSESVTDIATTDFLQIEVSGDIGTPGVSAVSSATGTTVDVTVNNITLDGTLRLDFIGLVTDLASNVHNDDDFITGQTYIIDNTAPTVTSINRQSPASQITNSASVTYRITFSEDLSDASFVAGDDLILTEVSGTLDLQSITSLTKINETTYDVVVGNYTGTGELRLDFTGIVTDLAGNNHNGDDINGTQTYLLDRDAPVAPAISSLVSVGGTVVSGYYNSTNTDITLQFTLPNDPTLVFDAGKGAGTYSVAYTLDGLTYYSLDSPNHTNVHILADDMDDLDGNVAEIGKLQTITITEAQLNTMAGGTLADGATINFKVNLQDRAYNNAAGGFGAAAAQSIIVDQTAPTAADIASLTSVSGNVVANYFNDSNTGVSATFTIPNDATLVGGKYSVQITTNSGGLYHDLTTPDYFDNTIIANNSIADANVGEVGTIQTISLTEAQLDSYGALPLAEGSLINFRVILTDAAGNGSGNGAEAASDILVDRVAPTITTVARVADDNPTEFVHFNPTGLYNRQAYIGHDITFSEVVTIATNYFHITGIDPTTRNDNTTNSTVNEIGVAGGPHLMSFVGNLTPTPSNRWVVYSSLKGNGGLDIHLDAVNNSTNVYDLAGNPPVEPDIVNIGTVENPNNQGYITLTTFAGDNEIIMDNIAPTVTITRNAVTNGSNFVTNDNTVSFDIDFSEQVQDFTIADIAINVTGVTPADLTGATLTIDNASLGEYTLTIPSVAGDGTLGITINNAAFTDLAGNQMAMNSVSALFTIDNTAPITPTPTVATTGGNIVANYFNATNTGVDITFTIPNDASLVGGIYSIQYAFTGGFFYLTNATPPIAYTNLPIIADDMDNLDGNVGEIGKAQTISLNKTELDALASTLNDADNIEFKVQLIDFAGNIATGSSSTAIDVDLTAPTAVAAPVLATTGSNQVAGYYNIASTGVTVGFTVPNEVGGTYQIQVFDDSDDSWDNIGSAVTIIANTGATANNEATDLASVTITDGDLTAYVTSAHNLNSLKFRVNATDIAGNSTNGAESNSVIVDETAPTQVAAPVLATTGTGQVAGYYNIASTGVTVGFTVPTEVGGTYTLQVWDADLSDWVNVTGHVDVSIIVDQGANNPGNNQANELASISITEAALQTLGIVKGAGMEDNDGQIFKFRVNVTDIAGNSITGSNESNSVTVDETTPVISGVTFNPASGLAKVGDQINVTVTLTGDETGATFVLGSSTINGVQPTLHSAFTFGTNTPGTVRYIVEEGHTDRAENVEVPMSITVSDAAGNSLVIDNTNNGIDETGTPAIDANSPALANNGFYVPGDVDGTPDEAGYNSVVPRIGLSYAGGDSKKVYNGADAATDDNVYFRVRVANDASLTGGTIQLQTNDQTLMVPSWNNIGSAHTIIGGNLGNNVDFEITEAQLITLNLNKSQWRAVFTDIAGNTLNSNTAHFGDYATTPVNYLTYSVVTPVLTYASNTGLDVCKAPSSTFTVTVNTANAAYTTSTSAYTVYFTDGVTPIQLTITGISGAQAAPKVLSVTVPANFTPSGIYDLKVDIVDPELNANTFTADLNVVVSVGTNAASLTSNTTEAICENATSVTMIYTTTTPIGDAETIVLNRTRGVNTTTVTPTSADPATNTVVVPIAEIQNGDIFSITVSGTGVCTPLTTTNTLTVTVNPLPTAATVAVGGATQPVCYNETATGVTFTVDAAVVDRSIFTYTYSIEKRVGATWSTIGNLTNGGDVTIASNVLTLKNIGTIVSDNNANGVRVTVTKTITSTGCNITTVSDVVTVNPILLAMSNAVTTYGGSSTPNAASPGRNTTINPTYTITAPAQGTPTSYNWRIVDGSNVVLSSSYATITATSTLVTNATLGLSNTIYFSATIPFATYYVQVQAVNSCGTSDWPAAGQGFAVTIARVKSHTLGFTSGRNGTDGYVNVTWVNGNYDGNILLVRRNLTNDATQTLSGNLDNSNLTGIIGVSPVNPSTAIGTSVSNDITFNSGAVTDVNYVFDNPTNSAFSVQYTFTYIKANRRWDLRLVDFEGTGDKSARTYSLDSPVNFGANSSIKLGTDTDLFVEETGNTISAISPNPAKEFIAFDMNLVESTNVTIIIHSMEGREVLRFADGKMFGAGLHNINIPLKDFISGAYGISISFGQEAIFETFMVMP